MVLIIPPPKDIKVELIPNCMRSNHRLIVFLVAAVIPLEKNITAFLIVASFIEGYILTSSTDAIVALYLFISNYSILSFRSDAWKMMTHE